MESSKVDHDTICELCTALRVQFYNESKLGYDLLDAAATHSLFHAFCDHCNEASFECVLQLCNFCRHLRFRHLLLCSRRLFPDPPKISIQPPKWESNHCDLCKFWIKHLRPGHKEAEDKEVEDVEYSLGFHGRGSFDIREQDRVHFSRTFLGAGENRERVRAYIDWDWVRDWLHKSPEPKTSAHTNLPLHYELHDVFVIDVWSNCIAQLPSGAKYLALSYVWGQDSKDHFHCSRANLSTLLQAGALRDICLPRTISDAILVCQRLDYRFLWVDRLCIVQDDSTEELSKQLNQMADVYYHATLTLVAAIGDSATHGLAGVSYARDAKQAVCKYGGDFELVTPTPWLQQILEDGKWWTRGWTFQEQVASKRLLFFTDYGLHLKNGPGMPQEIISEGFSDASELHDQELDLRLLQNYTQRQLTKETDVLHASSGFLRSIYGERLSYGMPLDDFDSAILWAPDTFDRGPRGSTSTEVFPTWSWISSIGPIRFDTEMEPVYSLAYWGIPTTLAANALGPLCWSTLEPTYPHTMSYSTSQFDDDHSIRYVLPALSWLHGCVQTEVPSYLSVDCALDEYAARLEKRWSGSPSPFWREAFQGYEQIFSTIDRELLREAGCLMVHAQKASLTLDWRGRHQQRINGKPQPGCHSVIIRNDKREIAGTCEISEHLAKRLHRLDQTHATFIALSTGSSFSIDEHCPFLSEYISRHFSHLPVGAFYGCPCFTEIGRSFEHIEECPEHADFYSIEPVRYRYSKWGLIEDDVDANILRDRKQAYAHHLAKLSYHDVNNGLLHDQELPPWLWVMLIAPRENDALQSKVYERICIGRIYLKRWVEASPVFESLVLV
ncbi:heterokaryon incompatibility protein-domain-containing protein [Phaeosphaeria sp. MPI-PUGE-AT-0046c]|nr:heterokaryon incompatibility protein-domain-containing protein [Phaeosphaeria sp. MPI-PUGE-AT-0046c]